jgi:signal transduction histidine kinase/CheY-like chemotaxis protein
VRRRLRDGTSAHVPVVLDARAATLPGMPCLLIEAHDAGAAWERERHRHQARRLEELGRLVGGIAHDFNNALVVVRACAGFILDAVRDGALPDAADAAEILRASHQASALTQRLLAFSRHQAIAPVATDAGAVVHETAALLRRLLGEDIRVEVTVDPSTPPILADPAQLEEVLLNLAVNARDAMPDGGRLSIRTRAVAVPLEPDAEGWPPLPAGRYLELEVADTGVGVPADLLPQLFEPFFTTKPPERGTGLGLAMVRAAVRAAGGDVAVRSAPGAGAVFRLCWPVMSAPAAIVEEHATATTDVATHLAARPRVLLVEDDEQVRIVVCRMLERAGHRVVEARDGLEALQRLAHDPEPIDLVLADVVMPNLGGRELVARLAAERPALPVVLMTGYDTAVADDEPASSLPLLRKPFGQADLLEALARATATRARR